MRTLNLAHLQTFLEVVECGSFSKAAMRLGVSQPAISLQIRNLESELGVRLIERLGKRAMPSAAGRDLLVHARRIGEDAQAAIARMEAYGLGQVGRVRIGTGAIASIYILPRVLASLRCLHPAIAVTIVTGNSASMIDAVEENAVDLAFVTLPVARRGLVMQELLTDPLVAALPPSARGIPKALAPRDFLDRDLILYERGGTIRSIIDAWFAAAGLTVRPAMELGNVEATKRFVAAGLGWSILPSIAMRGEHREPRVLGRPMTPALDRRLGLVLRQDKLRDEAMRVTLKAFEKLYHSTVTMA